MKLAIICSQEDIPYLAVLKPFLPRDVQVIERCPEFLRLLTDKYDGLICSQEAFLNVVVKKSRKVNLKDYAGSLLHRNGKPILIVPPIAQVYTLPYGKFLMERYLSKIIRPEMWSNSHEFLWEEVTSDVRMDNLYRQAQECLAISIDIETVQEPVPAITICSYGLIRMVAGKPALVNFTFAIDSHERLDWMRKFNDLPCPKIFQNGIYDNSWFTRYGAPVRNWSFDTMDLFHSWYSELPKRLDFVASFCVRDVWFWKNDGKTGKWEDYCEYGCRDVWATSCAFLYLIQAMPEWAIRNYITKFPVNFPSLLSGVRGWKIDEKVRDELKAERLPEVEDTVEFLGAVVGNPNFNPGSPKQVQAFLSVISAKKVVSSDEDSLKKVGSEHPLNQLLCDKVLAYRETSKLISTYLNARLIDGRFLYSLSPSGTDTARLSSSGSFLWSGGNIQNIPRGSVIKSCFVADDGYLLAEPDASQADARGMAYLSGDRNLIATVEADADYHSMNATKMFGLVLAQISEEIRDLSKRVNHGITFNMAEKTLLATMGAANVLRAQQLLKLPKHWSLLKVCAHLLEGWHNSYPDVRGKYYPYLVDMIRGTHRFTSPTGWTRWFFGQPWDKSRKHDLNLLIAHTAQNLTGQVINVGYRRLFDFERRTNGGIRILAQIHDSVPFQYKEDREDLAVEAARLMVVPTPVTCCQGITRTMTLPITLKARGRRWSELQKIATYRSAA